MYKTFLLLIAVALIAPIPELCTQRIARLRLTQSD
jgi:hypothetical protein